MMEIQGPETSNSIPVPLSDSGHEALTRSEKPLDQRERSEAARTNVRGLTKLGQENLT